MLLERTLACAALAAALLPGQFQADATLSRHPYLQLATPNSIVVVWRTTGAINPQVRFGTRPKKLDQRVDRRQIVVRLAPDVKIDVKAVSEGTAPRLHSAPAGTFQYEARITGLRPDREYYYAVYDGDRRLAGGDAEHRLRTLPVAGRDRPVRFWAVGDSGTGGDVQRAVFAAMRDRVQKDKRPPDFYMHLGDMAYTVGKDDQFQANFFAIYTELLRNTVCWPAMGNHEGYTSRGMTGIGPYYDAYVLPTKGEAGGLPSGKEAFYSFDFGNIHFVCLNSHDLSRKPDGEMALWLRADLERTKAKWLIAYWHHPPYTMGTHDSNREIQLREMRTHIMPILESGGVDLVLAGHSHIYERSMLIDGAYATPTTAEGVVLDDGDGDPQGDGPYRKSRGLKPHQGTVAIVAGTGGAAVGRVGTMPVMRSIFVEHGSVMVDVERDQLTAFMFDKDGVQRDLFRIVKQGTVAPKVVPFPWVPEGPRVSAFAREFVATAEVTMTPRPAAPDARIHFTLDGSEPSLESPVYKEPIRLTQSTRLKAFSVWRGGKRVSPVVTASFERLPEGTFMRRIVAVEDDAEEGASGAMRLHDVRLELARIAEKKPQTIGLRFRRVDIPRGAKIKRAYVQFAARNQLTEKIDLQVYVQQNANAAAFSQEAFDLTRRIAGAPSAEWSPPPWTEIGRKSQDERTPDLASLVQRVVRLSEWRSGNSLVVVIQPAVADGGKGMRTAVAFDREPDYAATLHIEFE